MNSQLKRVLALMLIKNIVIYKTKYKNMGKLFVKIGLWMQKVWCQFQCKWNWCVSKLMFDISKCKVEGCKCK